MSPDSAPASSRLHSEVHDGRRPVITSFPSHDAPRGRDPNGGVRHARVDFPQAPASTRRHALVVVAVLGGGIWLAQSGQSAVHPTSRSSGRAAATSSSPSAASGGSLREAGPGARAPGLRWDATSGSAAGSSSSAPADAGSRTCPGTWIACSSRRGSTSRRGSRSRDSTMTAHWPQQSSRRGSISRQLASSLARSCTTTRKRVPRRRPSSPRRARPSPRPAPTWLRRPAGRTRPT